MNNNFTRGPWHILGQFDDMAMVTNRDAQVVALVRREADARLIAAAPHLLRALLNFVNVLTPGKDFMVDGFLREADEAIRRSGFEGSYIESYETRGAEHVGR